VYKTRPFPTPFFRQNTPSTEFSLPKDSTRATRRYTPKSLSPQTPPTFVASSPTTCPHTTTTYNTNPATCGNINMQSPSMYAQSPYHRISSPPTRTRQHPSHIISHPQPSRV
jgi:hypothetical protein